MRTIPLLLSVSLFTACASDVAVITPKEEVVECTDQGIFYPDLDGDGFGDEDAAIAACEQPEGSIEVGGDCDDSDDSSHPDALELCDAVDHDCDGEPMVGATDMQVYYVDRDEDGFGDPELDVELCEATDAVVEAEYAIDCDDQDATVYPDADELCDGLDNDCDALVDEQIDGDITWYDDLDDDGFGAGEPLSAACIQPEGSSATSDDCDDLDAGVHPEAEEVCDGFDNDCDGARDTAEACDCELGERQGTEYLFCEEGESWRDAEQACWDKGYQLVTIEGRGESDWLASTAIAIDASGWWTGLNDRAREGRWAWSSGSNSSFRRWNSGEPNGGTRENCVVLRSAGDGTWNDVPCSNSQSFVCEYLP